MGDIFRSLFHRRRARTTVWLKTHFREKWIGGELLWSLEQTALITVIPKQMRVKPGASGETETWGLRSPALWAWRPAQGTSQCGHPCAPSETTLQIRPSCGSRGRTCQGSSGTTKGTLSKVFRKTKRSGSGPCQLSWAPPGLPQGLGSFTHSICSLSESAPFSFHQLASSEVTASVMPPKSEALFWVECTPRMSLSGC